MCFMLYAIFCSDEFLTKFINAIFQYFETVQLRALFFWDIALHHWFYIVQSKNL
jgi:hypothetical protein